MGEYSFGHSMYGFMLPNEGEAFLRALESLPETQVEWKHCWPKPASDDAVRTGWAGLESANLYWHRGDGSPSGVFVSMPIRRGDVLAQFVLHTWKGPKALVDPDFSLARKTLRRVAELSNNNVEIASPDGSGGRPHRRHWVSTGVRDLQAVNPALVLREDHRRPQGPTFRTTPIE